MKPKAIKKPDTKEVEKANKANIKSLKIANKEIKKLLKSEMKTQIPIYRAKKIDSDECVEGYLTYCPSLIGIKEEHIINVVHFDSEMGYEFIECVVDPSTLAIHFPDMIDSEGTKIFASLSEEGKGGDTFKEDGETFLVWFDAVALVVNATNIDNFDCNCHDALYEWKGTNVSYHTTNYDLKVTGKQE